MTEEMLSVFVGRPDASGRHPRKRESVRVARTPRSWGPRFFGRNNRKSPKQEEPQTAKTAVCATLAVRQYTERL